MRRDDEVMHMRHRISFGVLALVAGIGCADRAVALGPAGVGRLGEVEPSLSASKSTSNLVVRSPLKRRSSGTTLLASRCGMYLEMLGLPQL